MANRILNCTTPEQSTWLTFTEHVPSRVELG